MEGFNNKSNGVEKNDLKSEQRRRLLQGAIAAALGATVLPRALDKVLDNLSEGKNRYEDPMVTAIENRNQELAYDIDNILQNGESLPTFANEVAGYKMAALARNDEIFL